MICLRIVHQKMTLTELLEPLALEMFSGNIFSLRGLPFQVGIDQTGLPTSIFNCFGILPSKGFFHEKAINPISLCLFRSLSCRMWWWRRQESRHQKRRHHQKRWQEVVFNSLFDPSAAIIFSCYAFRKIVNIEANQGVCLCKCLFLCAGGTLHFAVPDDTWKSDTNFEE